MPPAATQNPPIIGRRPSQPRAAPGYHRGALVELIARVRSSMDRVLPSEGRGCWFDPSRAHQFDTCLGTASVESGNLSAIDHELPESSGGNELPDF